MATLDSDLEEMFAVPGEGSGEFPFDVQPKKITEKEFTNFQQLIHHISGIWLPPAKATLLVGRLLKRLRIRGFSSFDEYYGAVTSEPEELTEMLNAISTNETRFFREPLQFEFLEQRILPQWKADGKAGKRSRRIRVWSAGCSTGQEPYSLAMLLLHHLPPSEGWGVEIIATDLSTRALETATEATWELARACEIPDHYLKAFMLKGYGEQEGKLKAGPEIRQLVHFFQLNLNDPVYPISGKFDLILCRNVLIYFNVETRTRIVRRLLQFLLPEGHLFAGHAESLHTMCGELRAVVPTIYKHARRTGQQANARH